MSARHGLVLLSREGCGLCEEFAAEFEALRAELPAIPALQSVDVDDDPELQRRFGLKIPVLLWDGEPILVSRFDAGELRRLFRAR